MKRNLYIAFFGMLALLVVSGLASLYELAQLRAKHLALFADMETYTVAMIRLEQHERAYLRVYARTRAAALTAQASLESLVQTFPQARTPEEDTTIRLLRVAFAKRRLHLSTNSGDSADEEISRLISSLDDIRKNYQLDGQRQLALEFARTRGRATIYLLICLTAGLALGLLSLRHHFQLQDRLQHKLAQIQSLSTKILFIQEEERKSISRNLHDQVGQSLGVMAMDASRLGQMLASTNPEARELARGIQQHAETVMNAVRDLSLNLRPSMLDDLGLVAAVEWLARESSRRSSTEVEVDHDHVSSSLPDSVNTCVYRLVQESLRNVVTHAAAKCAWVKLRQSSTRIEVEIKDDGKGFAPSTVKGLGLLGMAERVSQLGGEFFVQSKPGAGTTVHAWLPIHTSTP